MVHQEPFHFTNAINLEIKQRFDPRREKLIRNVNCIASCTKTRPTCRE